MESLSIPHKTGELQAIIHGKMHCSCSNQHCGLLPFFDCKRSFERLNTRPQLGHANLITSEMLWEELSGCDWKHCQPSVYTADKNTFILHMHAHFEMAPFAILCETSVWNTFPHERRNTMYVQKKTWTLSLVWTRGTDSICTTAVTRAGVILFILIFYTSRVSIAKQKSDLPLHLTHLTCILVRDFAKSTHFT